LILMWMLWACAAPVEDTASARGARPSEEEDSGSVQPDEEGSTDEVADTDGGALGDDAWVVGADFPGSLGCGESASASITVQNAGDSVWTRDALYKLGTVADEDPFHGSTRAYLDDGVAVAPGDEHTFELELTAPEAEGSYLTDWQMVLENVHWFGEVLEVTVDVVCDQDEQPPLDLDDVTWLHTDVSGWDVTSTIASVSVDSSNICFDYDKADEWPIFDYNGTDVVGNPWIFIWHDDQWYGATWEWLRPEQTCKARTSVAGDHIKQSPFDESSGWTPTSGETYYLMVSGLARDSNRNVQERTEPVAFVWP